MSDSEFERYKRAYQRVRQLRSFYTSLASFIVVNSFLCIIDLIDGGSWWFYWLTIFWGFGLVVHGWSVFLGSRFTSDWEDRKIREYMEREKANSKTSEPGQ